MNSLMRVLPIVVGVVVGYLLVARPEWLSKLDPTGGVGISLAVLLGFFALIALVVLKSLPRDVQVRQFDNAKLDREMVKLVAQYEVLGFKRIAPGAMEVGVTPPAMMVGLVHQELATYGTVYRTSTTPPKLGCDFVSVLDLKSSDAPLGGVTTCPDPAGATLPAGRGTFVQVFRGASIDTMFEQHLRALSFLHERGITTRKVSEKAFVDDLRRALAAQRKTFLSNLPINLLRVLWRSATRTSPHNGPIDSQGAARSEVERITRARLGF